MRFLEAWPNYRKAASPFDNRNEVVHFVLLVEFSFCLPVIVKYNSIPIDEYKPMSESSKVNYIFELV